MKKNTFFITLICLLCTTYICADTTKEDPQFIAASDTKEFDAFADIFEEQDSVVEFHDHIEEEIELVALEGHASKPTKPSELTVAMRKLGLKVLLGYVAIQSYFEQLWDGFKTTVTRLGIWLSGDLADET